MHGSAFVLDMLRLVWKPITAHTMWVDIMWKTGQDVKQIRRGTSHLWFHYPCSPGWRSGFEREVQGCSQWGVQEWGKEPGWVRGWRGFHWGWCWSCRAVKVRIKAGAKSGLQHWCSGWRRGSLNRGRQCCRSEWSWDSPPERRCRTEKGRAERGWDMTKKLEI